MRNIAKKSTYLRHQKKVLALVLAFACAFTMFAGAAFTDEADIQATDAVNMLTALGVVEGNPDGSFKPDATVTRAEMAKMIFVVRNNTIDDSAYENNSSKMTDIS
ncbi:S-layer homology domain-containing protein, partial [Agathobaculum sp. TL06]